MTENIESNIILEVTDDEGEIQLLMSLKCAVIVAETAPPIRNTPHSTSRLLCETKVENYQHKTETTTYHYI